LSNVLVAVGGEPVQAGVPELWVLFELRGFLLSVAGTPKRI